MKQPEPNLTLDMLNSIVGELERFVSKTDRYPEEWDRYIEEASEHLTKEYQQQRFLFECEKVGYKWWVFFDYADESWWFAVMRPTDEFAIKHRRRDLTKSEAEAACIEWLKLNVEL